MAIQNRRGNYSDFDPSKMVEGEIAVVKNGDPNTSDGTAIYVSTATGSAKRIALHQDIIQEVYDATEEAIPNYIDNSLTEDGKAADAKKTGDEITALKEDLENKADPDGTYPDMTVGTAQQLETDQYTEDSEPYHFRKSGDGNVRVGDREIDKIVGGTVAWNQLAPVYSFSGTGGHSFISGTTITANHKMLLGYKRDSNAGSSWIGIYCRANGTNQYFSLSLPANGALSGMKISAVPLSGVSNGTALNSDGNAWIYQESSATITDLILIDLTQAFGTTIADYIYQLEQSTAGAGVAFLRRYIDIDTYHPYDTGTLKSVEGLVSHDMVGFNQWDEELETGLYNSSGKTWGDSYWRCANPIKVIPNKTYYVQFPSGVTIYTYGYSDANFSNGRSLSVTNNMVTIPNGVYYFAFAIQKSQYGTTYNNDICINLSDPAKNGTYEPYEKHNYPLDSTLTLRGVPKLVDGKLVADGDEYASDGTVTRRYGVVDLGTLTWSLKTGASGVFYSWSLQPVIKAINNANIIDNHICSKLIVETKSAVYDNMTIDNAISAGYQGGIYLRITSCTTREEVTSALSGVMLVYELATPITEEAAPFTSPQWVDGSGTEQYVSTSLVPIGHYTQYPEDLVSKIEGLPWNFASLIAPTEATYKATQAYSTGALFIVNNILYKATAAIANGGTITPGTNCTTTTLAAVIAAL